MKGARRLLALAASLMLGCAPGGETESDTMSSSAGTTTQSSATTGSTDTDSTDTDSTATSSTDTGTSTGDGDSCEPVLQEDDSPSGVEVCAALGASFSASAETCVDPLPPALGFPCNERYGTCSTNEDCVEQPYGACQAYGDFVITCACAYGCTSDADCAEGEACLCSPTQGGTICTEAECRTDADCPGDLRCGLSFPPQTTTIEERAPTLHCRTPADSCAGDVDCGEGGLCSFDGEAWSC